MRQRDLDQRPELQADVGQAHVAHHAAADKLPAGVRDRRLLATQGGRKRRRRGGQHVGGRRRAVDRL